MLDYGEPPCFDFFRNFDLLVENYPLLDESSSLRDEKCVAVATMSASLFVMRKRKNKYRRGRTSETKAKISSEIIVVLPC